MSYELLSRIVTNLKQGVRVMVPLKTSSVYMNGVVVPERCKMTMRAQHSFVAVKYGKTTRLFPLDHVMVRNMGPISTCDPIYRRWVRERKDVMRAHRERAELRRETWWHKFRALETLTMDFVELQDECSEEEYAAVVRHIERRSQKLLRSSRDEPLLRKQKQALKDFISKSECLI